VTDNFKTFCKRCELDKKLEEMVSSSIYGIGYKYLCKNCDAKDSKIRRNKDKEKERKSQEKSYYKNRDKILKHKKEIYTPLTRSHRSEYNKKYQDDNREELNKKSAARLRKRIKNDPIFRLRKNLSTRIRHALKAKGFSKGKRTWEILGTDKEGLISHFMSTQGIDIIDKNEWINKEVDHICPLDQARNEEELLILNHYTNLQLLDKKDNLIKSNKKTIEAENKCKELLGREWVTS